MERSGLQSKLPFKLGCWLYPQVNTVIPLKWIEETMNLSNENNMLPSEMNNVEDPIPSDQSLNNQIDMGKMNQFAGLPLGTKKLPTLCLKIFYGRVKCF